MKTELGHAVAELIEPLIDFVGLGVDLEVVGAHPLMAGFAGREHANGVPVGHLRGVGIRR